MYCPKCGQITVNIDDKDICTACGLVFDDSLPRSQILRQLKSKISGGQKEIEPEKSASPQDDYLKGMLLASEKEKEKVLVQQENTEGQLYAHTAAATVPIVQEEKTVSQISHDAQRGIHLNNQEPMEGEEESTSKLRKEQPEAWERYKEGHLNKIATIGGTKSLTHLPETRLEDSNRAPIETQKLGQKYQANGVAQVEGSHGFLNVIRLVFIKALFYLLFVIFLGGSGYFIYKDGGKILAMFDKASIYVGEHLFK